MRPTEIFYNVIERKGGRAKGLKYSISTYLSIAKPTREKWIHLSFDRRLVQIGQATSGMPSYTTTYIDGAPRSQRCPKQGPLTRLVCLIELAHLLLEVRV